MDERVDNIFKFLKTNRIYNHRMQALDYAGALVPYNTVDAKVLSLLNHILNTQSHPKLDKLKVFFQYMYRVKRKIRSFKGLLISLGASGNFNPSYDLLFDLLIKQPGWGNKTTALFVKAIYKLHYGKQKNLGFYKDVPRLLTSDRLYVPVDRVITNIFVKFDLGIHLSFKGINDFLRSKYTGDEIEIWDDLWYWGFITQKGGDKGRKFEYNEAKYWVLLHNDKKPTTIAKVKRRAEAFIGLLGNKI